MKNWENVKIEDYVLTYNQYNRPQFHSCNWCGNPAIKVITRTSFLTGNTYSDFACERHTKEWKEGLKNESSKMC